MSAGFEVASEVFWGTNGAVEAYVEALATHAADRFGPDAPIAVFFRDQRDSFYPGWVVCLDEWLADETGRERFLGLLDAATAQLLGNGTFTDYGREWVASVVAHLRARVSGVGAAEPE